MGLAVSLLELRSAVDFTLIFFISTL